MSICTADCEILLEIPKSRGMIMNFGFTAIGGLDSALLELSPSVHIYRTEKSGCTMTENRGQDFFSLSLNIFYSCINLQS